MTEEIRTLLARHLPGHKIRCVTGLGEGLDNATFEVDGELVVRKSKEADPALRADAIRRETALLAAVARISTLPAVGAIHVGIGALLYERDDLDGAERALETGIGMAELTGNVTDLVWGYVNLSRAKRARRDERGALEMAHKADRVARDYGADLEIATAAALEQKLAANNSSSAWAPSRPT
jgi:hypothetical protein